MSEIPGEFVERCRKLLKYDPNEPYSLYWYDTQIERGIELSAEGYRNGLIKALGFIISVRTDFPLALTAIEEQRKRIAELESENGLIDDLLREGRKMDKKVAELKSENSCMARQLAEPPERLLRIAELERQLAETREGTKHE